MENLSLEIASINSLHPADPGLSWHLLVPRSGSRQLWVKNHHRDGTQRAIPIGRGAVSRRNNACPIGQNWGRKAQSAQSAGFPYESI